MPRIDIELTSGSPDGSWTWRAAGAREPRGVLDGGILPAGAAVGDHFKVEADYEIEGITVRSVVPTKEKAARELLELIPADRPFEPVIQQRARPERSDRGDRGDRGPRGADRRDRSSDRRDRDDRPPRPARDRPDRPEGRTDRRDRGQDRGQDRGGRDDARPESADRRRHRPHFTPPPEVPQRPKPKRLRPGKQHRTEVLAALPEEQRPIAELALHGMSAVRQRLKEDNARLRAEGKPEMPAASVLKLAEELIPKIRVAEWLDRAEAAQRQLDGLDLRDLRSVVAASDDPAVARDESTRGLAVELKAALATKQEQEQQLWLTDVEAALDVGRIIRALRLSSQPPKAGVPFPGPLALRLGEATTASLQPTDGADRWAAVLEAAAFSPVRAHVTPTAAPEQPTDELRATVKRLGPLLPQIAALFGIEVAARAPAPKPLRPTSRRRDAPAKPDAKPDAAATGRSRPTAPGRATSAKKGGGASTSSEPPVIEPPAEPPVIEPPVEPPVIEPPVEPPVIEPPVEPPVIAPPVEPPVIEPPVEPPVIEPPVIEPPSEPPVIEPPVIQPPSEPPVEPPVIAPPVEPPVIEPPVEPPVELPSIEPPSELPDRPPVEIPDRPVEVDAEVSTSQPIDTTPSVGTQASAGAATDHEAG